MGIAVFAADAESSGEPAELAIETDPSVVEVAEPSAVELDAVASDAAPTAAAVAFALSATAVSVDESRLMVRTRANTPIAAAALVARTTGSQRLRGAGGAFSPHEVIVSTPSFGGGGSV